MDTDTATQDRTCIAPNCDRQAVAKGLCGPHRKRLARGHPDPLGPLRIPFQLCSVDGCDIQVTGLGYCRTHLARFKRNGTVELQKKRQPSDRKCAVETCDKIVSLGGAKDYCGAHYHRFKRYGDPLGGYRLPNGTADEERFWARVDKTGEHWLFTGATGEDGYGRFMRNRESTDEGRQKSVMAHRYAWRLTYGSDPLGELDHLCYVRNCVKVEHLEETDHAENMARGFTRRVAEKAAYALLDWHLRALCRSLTGTPLTP